MSFLTGIEVAEQLRRAIRNEITVTLIDPSRSWANAFAGDVAFMFDDWVITFFNDCDELDYCDSAQAADGRQGEFNAWWDAHEEPICLLNEMERSALEVLLEKAR